MQVSFRFCLLRLNAEACKSFSKSKILLRFSAFFYPVIHFLSLLPQVLWRGVVIGISGSGRGDISGVIQPFDNYFELSKRLRGIRKNISS